MMTNIIKTFALSVTLICVAAVSGCINIIEPDNLTDQIDIGAVPDNATIFLPPLEYDYAASIIYDDIERTFIIHIGRGYDAMGPVPLVFVLHGDGSTAEGMAAFTGFNAIADRENFIAVYPEGFENHWNDGREPKVYTAHVEDIDDTGFIAVLIDALSSDLNIDVKRIYVTGISNGGMMSHRLACELSDRIAAIAPVAASIPANMADTWAPSGPVSVLIINGVDDPLVPWEGGEIDAGTLGFGDVLSAADTVEFWITNNGCSTRPEITRLSDRNEADGTSVWKETYSSCDGGTEVVLFGIEGGGHTWPGGYQYADELLIGKTSLEFDASEIIWQFFKEHPLE
jgi:polyhydroxybutyrate depolymerase